ncbi:MAG: hypothetical protein Q9187_005343, partial [Circinaria calcarea]
MALDLPLPRQILTHAHWTLGHEKMSKSTGNVVNPFFAIDRFGVDAMRYYLAHDGGIRDDADYENSYIVDRYKKGLQGGLGNLASRIMRGKGWNVRKAVEWSTTGNPPADGDLAKYHRALLMKLPGIVTEKMEGLNSGAALKMIMNTIYKVQLQLPSPLQHTSDPNLQTNVYMQNTQPWDLVGSAETSDQLN